MTKKCSISWEEYSESLPDDLKASIAEDRFKDRWKFRVMSRFREIKELVREHLRTEKNLDTEDIRQIEKHADLLLSVYRKIIEKEGGKFKVKMNVPNHVPYNLFHLRDSYQKLEGTPLGPFYEEEDINEANRLEEIREEERQARI